MMDVSYVLHPINCLHWAELRPSHKWIPCHGLVDWSAVRMEDRGLIAIPSRSQGYAEQFGFTVGEDPYVADRNPQSATGGFIPAPTGSIRFIDVAPMDPGPFTDLETDPAISY